MAGFDNWARRTTSATDLTQGNVGIRRTTTDDGRIAEERWERYDGPAGQPQSRLLTTETILFDAAGNQRQLTQTRWQQLDGPGAQPDDPPMQSSHTAIYGPEGHPVSTMDIQSHLSARDLSAHVTASSGDLQPSAEDIQVPYSWQHRTFDAHGREVSLTTWDDQLGTGSEVLHRYRDGGVLTTNSTLAHHQHGHPLDRGDAPEPGFLPPGAYISAYEGFIRTISSTQDYRGADNYHIHTTSDGRIRTVEIDTADRTTHRTVTVDVRSDRILHAEVTTTRPDHSVVRDTFDAAGAGERTVTSPKGALTHLTFDSQGNPSPPTPGFSAAASLHDVQERRAAFRVVESPESKGHDSHLLPEDAYSRPCDPADLVHSHGVADASSPESQQQPRPNQPDGLEFALAAPTESGASISTTCALDADPPIGATPTGPQRTGPTVGGDDDIDDFA